MAAEMTLTISATDKASAVVKSIEGSVEGFKGKVATAFDSLKTNIIAWSVGVAAALKVVSEGMQAVSRYADFAELREQLNGLAGKWGVTGDSIVSAARKASDGILSIEEATRTTATALKNNLPPEMILGLARAASTLNDVMGVSVAEAFDRLTTSIAKGAKPAILEMITGNNDLVEKFNEVSKGMSGAEKSAWLYAETMKSVDEVAARVGVTHERLANDLDRAKAAWSNTTLILAGVLTAAVLGTASALIYLYSGAVKAAEGMAWLALKIAEHTGASPAYIAELKKTKDALGEMSASAVKLATDYSLLSLSGLKSQEVHRGMIAPVAAVTAAQKDEAAAIDAANDKWKLINGTWTQVNSATTAVAAGLGQIKTAADSIPKDVQVKVTTTYVDVRTGAAPSGAQEGGPGTVGRGPDGTSYGNWGGMFNGGAY